MQDSFHVYIPIHFLLDFHQISSKFNLWGVETYEIHVTLGLVQFSTDIKQTSTVLFVLSSTARPKRHIDG